MTETKTRAARKPMTEFGQAFRGFVLSVNPAKLAIKVGQLTGETDADKTQGAIASLVRKAGQNSGVVSIRSKPMVEAIVQCVVELDPDLSAKGQTMLKNFQFEQISNANREPGANWLVKLKAGEEVNIKGGPDGDGVYILQYVRPMDEDATDATEADA